MGKNLHIWVFLTFPKFLTTSTNLRLEHKNIIHVLVWTHAHTHPTWVFPFVNYFLPLNSIVHATQIQIPGNLQCNLLYVPNFSLRGPQRVIFLIHEYLIVLTLIDLYHITSSQCLNDLKDLCRPSNLSRSWERWGGDEDLDILEIMILSPLRKVLS